jgi:hypothetical protein
MAYKTDRLAFPRTQRLAYLFEKVTPYAVGRPEVLEARKGQHVSTYCAVSAPKFRGSLCVRPTQRVMDCIAAEMLVIDDDRIYFEIIDRGNGTALVVAKYNKIIGSRWLALIPSSEIPRRTARG